jgi:predicted TPR repeat methyltransferase
MDAVAEQRIRALHARALAAERAGDASEALALVDEALAEAPEDAALLLTRGAALARLGQPVAALACFEGAAARAPGRAACEHLVTALGGRGFAQPLLGEVVELFDRTAGHFEEHVVKGLGYRGHELLVAAVRAAAGADAGDWEVLDLGCGTGLCAPLLRPLARRLRGVDAAAEMVARALELDRYDEVWVADLVYALAMEPDASLDLVTAADVLGYVGDLRAPLQEAARALRPGGRCAFTVEVLAPGRGDWALGPRRRVAYAEAYLRAEAGQSGLAVEHLEGAPLRREEAAPVSGHVVVLRRD